MGCDLAERLVRDNEVIEQILICKVEGNRELKGVKSSQAVRETVPAYEALRPYEVILSDAINFDVASRDIE